MNNTVNIDLTTMSTEEKEAYLAKLKIELTEKSDTLVSLIREKVDKVLDLDTNIDKVRDLMSEIEWEIRFVTDDINAWK